MSVRKRVVLRFLNYYIKSNKNGDFAMSHKVSIVIEKDENGYYAFCPNLEGCHSQGDTFEEAMENIKEAIELYIETLSEDEIKDYLSQQILTTTLEVKVA